MKKIVFCFILALLFALTALADFEIINEYKGFDDVKETAWYHENVKTAFGLGFMNGKSEGTFDPDGNVTVAEGITMASRLHGLYYGINADSYKSKKSERRFDFDTDDNISFNNATGSIEDGVLKLCAVPRVNNGRYDPGIYLNNLSIDARIYKKIVVRMKRDRLENPYEETHRSELLEVFFTGDTDVLMRQERCVTKSLKSDGMSDWFEVEIDMSQNDLWLDNIKQIRFDPTNNNGIYYIDYIYFTSGEDTGAKWYHRYVDYAVENGIISQGEYKQADFERNITRKELCYLFASALPEEYFAPINDVRAIPDMDKNDYYADVVLMLYKAGVVLGDAVGNFNPDADIKRSETAAIIGRGALSNKRVMGSVDASWDKEEYSNDYEFDDTQSIESLSFEAQSVDVSDGVLILTAKERPQSALKYDPKIIDNDACIDADLYPVMRIRMKADFEEAPNDTRCDIFFMHEDDETFTETDSYHPDLFEDSYVDASGWFVIELNMYKAKNWKGKIKALRFDPSNNGGTYSIDYIRFIKSDAKTEISKEELESNYISRRIFPDETFENGFIVNTAGTRLTGERASEIDGIWNYNDSKDAPLWEIGPWWTDYDFYKNMDPSADKYTLADKQGVKSLKYNPEEKSLTFTLNADKVYKGEPHNSGELWPHLIIIHDLYDDDYSKVLEERRPELSLSADKVYAEVDIKLNSSMNSANREGELLSNFLIFFYFAHKEIPGFHTYFGLRPVGFNNDAGKQYGWHNDSHSKMKIYSVPMMDLYESEEDSLWRDDGNLVTGVWKHIRVDITPHIQNMIRLCNDENVYGRPVSIDDFWISGVNAGYEIRGNFRMEVEMKNLNLVCYDKK